MIHDHPARELAAMIADQMAHPGNIRDLTRSQAWRPQSLANGIAGIALLHIELAAADLRPWQRVHDWLGTATHDPIITGAGSHLFHGAPALAHALACAAAIRPSSYEKALDRLDAAISTDTRRRIDAAHARIDQHRLAALAEFDVIRGLAGIGAYLLRRDLVGNAIRAVLSYLVRLTEPITVDGETVPGWWTTCGPSGRDDVTFPGGHGNTGVAHGVGGPLGLLALAALRGVTVNGQQSAIMTLCGWLDQWRTTTEAGPAWPYWVTRSELRAGRLDGRGPQRPSWCYGTAGLARVQQLAALATGDAKRQTLAEDAVVRALSDPRQRAATTDRSLCHGYAGLAHVAARVAGDADPTTAQHLHDLIPVMLDAVQPADTEPGAAAASLLKAAGVGPGLLDGAAGTALAAIATTVTAPRCGWDTCLLIA